MERNSHCGLIRVCLWGANTELPPFRSSQVSKQFYLWSKFHPDITPCGRKQSPSNPPIPGSSHCWGLALHTQVNAGKRWWEIVLYYRQWFELMGIPLRVFFWVWTKDKEVWSLSSNNELPRSQKMRNNSHCPWSAGSITQKLGVGIRPLQFLSFRIVLAVGGGKWWDVRTEVFLNPFSVIIKSIYLLSNCPQMGSWNILQISRTDSSLQLEMNSSVVINMGPKGTDKWHNTQPSKRQ